MVFEFWPYNELKFRWVNLEYTSWDKKGKNLADSIFSMREVNRVQLLYKKTTMDQNFPFLIP